MDRRARAARGSTSTNLFLQNSYIIIMALCMLLVIAPRHIDLSVRSVVGFRSAPLLRLMMVNWTGLLFSPFPPALIVGISHCAAARLTGLPIGVFHLFIRDVAGCWLFRVLSLWLP